MVCGSPEIPLSLLKSVATYKGIDATSSLVQWFWEVMEEFSNQERSLFLRFVWGRTRLPRTIADFRGRDFVLQVLDKYNPPDHFLPESYTCFFLLKMPRYSCKVSRLFFLFTLFHFYHAQYFLQGNIMHKCFLCYSRSYWKSLSTPFTSVKALIPTNMLVLLWLSPPKRRSARITVI